MTLNDEDDFLQGDQIQKTVKLQTTKTDDLEYSTSQLDAETNIQVIKVDKNSSKKQYRIFLILGIGTLMPFNCVIVPVDFWMKFYDSIFLSAASLGYNAGNWASMVLMLFISTKIKAKTVVPICLSVFLVSLIIIPIFHVLISDKTAKTVVTLIPIFSCGIANGFFFPIILDSAQKLNPINAQSIMAGQGIAGLVPQFILIILKMVFQLIQIEEEQQDFLLFIQTLVYFIIGALFIVFCFLSWFKLQKWRSDPLLEQKDELKIKIPIMKTIKDIKIPIISIFLIFAVTLAIFPTIIAQIPCNYLYQQNKQNTDDGWWNIGVMTTFMVFDYVGRSMVVFKWAQKPSLGICFITSILRIIFFLLFMIEALPNYICTENCSNGPVIKVDELTILTMILFAISNGWIGSLVMMKFSSKVQKEEIQQASVVQSFALNTGLFVGGLLSLAVAMPFK